jgi:hypothetical protein
LGARSGVIALFIQQATVPRFCAKPSTMIVLLLQAAYISSQACAACHPAIARQYRETPMARSSGRVVADLPQGVFRHGPSGIQYRMVGTQVGFERPGGLRGQREVQFYLGSGAAGRSYLVQQDGYLFQAPVTWYTQKRAWDISPGQEQQKRMRWNRPIEPNCLYCHASLPRHISGTQNRYDSPPFAEDGVGCERCHGPGSQHAKGAGPVVNPAKLSPQLRDDICSQCHLTGEARVNLPSKQIAMYRPGQPLNDYVAFFVYQSATGQELKATSHVEKLSRSRCKQASGDRLWCGACHDPHRVPAAETRVAWYRDKCLACHTPEQCRRGDDCASCHMPRARAVNGGHGVLTDHSIPRRAGARGNALGNVTPRRLVTRRGSRSDARTLGLAYAELALETSESFHEDEAFRLLREALPFQPRDPELLTRLAWLYQRRGENGRAASLYEAALKPTPTEP